MRKEITKQSFFDKLGLSLSFYFNNQESASILSDYEEWFKNETLCGKSEKEICTALEHPRTIAKKMFIESGSSSSRFFILSHNPIIQIILLSMIHLLAIFVLLYDYNKNNMVYICTASFINILYFIIGIKIIRKVPDNIKPHNFIKKHLLILCLVILPVPIIHFFTHQLLEFVDVGPTAVFIFGTYSLIGYIINIIFTIRRTILDRQFTQFTFSIFLHASGGISLLVFQMYLYLSYLVSVSEVVKTIIYGSTIIYAEIFIFCWISLKKVSVRE